MSKKKTGVLLNAASLSKRYPESSTAETMYLDEDAVLWLPSQIIPFNYQLGGGIPYGRIIEAHGEESTGKTAMALNFAKVTTDCGGVVLWDDAECVFDKVWAKKHGVDTSRVVVFKDQNIIERVSDWIADMAVYWRSKLPNNEPILLVIDSLAALDTLDNMESSDVDVGEDRGRIAKKITQMLRKRNPILAKYGICTYCINQLKKKPNATKFEDPDTVPGGKAMNYYAGARLGLYGGRTIKIDADGKELEEGKGKRVGRIVYCRTKKNKLAPPRENIQLKFFYIEHNGEFGFSRNYWLDEILVETGVVERRRGGRYYFKGNEIAHGDKQFQRLLRQDMELRKRLINKSKINTPSKFKEKLASIEGNLYPVNLKAKSDKSDDDDGEE